MLTDVRTDDGVATGGLVDGFDHVLRTNLTVIGVAVAKRKFLLPLFNLGQPVIEARRIGPNGAVLGGQSRQDRFDVANYRNVSRDVLRDLGRIDVKVLIMNNGCLGMVRQWQELFWEKRYSHVDMGDYPDFVKLAEAYGATGVRLTDKSTLVDDIRAAIATPGPVVVDVRVTEEESVYPMISPGMPARDMVG